MLIPIQRTPTPNRYNDHDCDEQQGEVYPAADFGTELGRQQRGRCIADGMKKDSYQNWR